MTIVTIPIEIFYSTRTDSTGDETGSGTVPDLSCRPVSSFDISDNLIRPGFTGLETKCCHV